MHKKVWICRTTGRFVCKSLKTYKTLYISCHFSHFPQNLVLLTWFAVLSIANSANILFLCPFPSPSHWFLLQNFVKELVNRGHVVTSVVSKPISNFNSSNYIEILIDPPFDLDKNCELPQSYRKNAVKSE